MAEAINGSLRITHTLDDDEDNVMEVRTLFRVADDDVDGVINVMLWGESTYATMDAQKADQCNINIKKIKLTDTTIAQADFFLLK